MVCKEEKTNKQIFNNVFTTRTKKFINVKLVYCLLYLHSLDVSELDVLR